MIIAAVIAATTGCARYDLDEVLLAREEVSLTMKKVVQFSFDPVDCQMSYNDARYEFRVYDDALANWFTLKCDAQPSSEGQSLKADVTWTTSSNTRTLRGLEFTIEKVTSDGFIYMWNDSSKMGAVIRIL